LYGLIVVSLYFVCCLIVVPLPPGENPFAVNNNNNNNNKVFDTFNVKRRSAVPQYFHIKSLRSICCTDNIGIFADANKLENSWTVPLTSYLRQALSRVPQRITSRKRSCTNECTCNIPNYLLRFWTNLILVRIDPAQPPLYINLKSMSSIEEIAMYRKIQTSLMSVILMQTCFDKAYI
jgi:hypothetical protein